MGPGWNWALGGGGVEWGPGWRRRIFVDGGLGILWDGAQSFYRMEPALAYS
jgi:hypothetical protein